MQENTIDKVTNQLEIIYQIITISLHLGNLKKYEKRSKKEKYSRYL